MNPVRPSLCSSKLTVGFRFCALGLAAASGSLAAAEPEIVGGILTSVEVYRNQVGPSATTVRYYSAFDEAFGLPLTSLSVSLNGGPADSISPNPQYGGEFKRRQDYTTVGDMLAARPIGASYAYNYSLVGGGSGALTNSGPSGVSFADAVPATPLFTFSVPGVWSVQNGRGVFTFNPIGVTSFTATLNTYDASVRGGNYEYRYNVYDASNGFTHIEDGGDFASDNVVAPSVVLSFAQGLPVNGGDSNPSTFGFVNGTRLELEGEFFNHFGLTIDEQGILNSFVFGSTTGVTLVAAIPEPSSAAALAGVLVLGLGTSRRRRR